jgi:hypothetical protein
LHVVLNDGRAPQRLLINTQGEVEEFELDHSLRLRPVGRPRPHDGRGDTGDA